MEQHTLVIGAFFLAAVGWVVLFAFVAVATWSDARRREREAYYRSETLKKIAETQQPGSAAALELYREHERIAFRRRREGIKLAGLITLAVGIATFVFIMQVEGNNNVHMVGLIPMLVGSVLTVYGYLLAPKDIA